MTSQFEGKNHSERSNAVERLKLAATLVDSQAAQVSWGAGISAWRITFAVVLSDDALVARYRFPRQLSCGDKIVARPLRAIRAAMPRVAVD